MNLKDLLRCGNVEPSRLIVDLGESHFDPVYFDNESNICKDGVFLYD